MSDDILQRYPLQTCVESSLPETLCLAPATHNWPFINLQNVTQLLPSVTTSTVRFGMTLFLKYVALVSTPPISQSMWHSCLPLPFHKANVTSSPDMFRIYAIKIKHLSFSSYCSGVSKNTCGL